MVLGRFAAFMNLRNSISISFRTTSSFVTFNTDFWRLSQIHREVRTEFRQDIQLANTKFLGLSITIIFRSRAIIIAKGYFRSLIFFPSVRPSVSHFGKNGQIVY